MKNLLLLFIIIPSFVHATTYYVAPNGNDNNPGTINSPFKNWQKLGSVMTAGDIAYIRGGTYITPYTALNVYIHCLWSGLNGTAANPIIIQNYPGEKPVFDFSSLGNSNRDYAQALYIENCQYLTVKGLRITGMKQILDGSGICIGNSIMSSSFVTMDQIEIDNIGGTGFRTGNSNDVTYINCDAHHNDDRYSPNDPWGGTDGFAGSGGEGSTRTTYTGCRSWWNSDDGFDFFGTDGKRTMINCWSFWNGYQPGTFLTAGNGNGFKLGPTATNQSGNVLKFLNNCLAFENRSSGFDQNNGQCRYQLYNNTSYKNGQYGYEWAYYTSISQDFKNNIGYANVSTNMHHSGNATGSNNTWNGGVTVNNADFLSVSSAGVDGPRQPDGSLPDLNFLKLAQGSDLIDAGIDVGLPFTGSAPDMGAYEYISAANIPPAPVVGVITQPTCAVATGGVVLNNLPSSGTWTLTRSPGGITTNGTGTTTTITGLATGTYTYTVTNGTGTSVPSSNIVINAQPVTPTAPVVGTITQPTCLVATGIVILTGLPATGTWTLTRTPGNVTTTGTGTNRTITGLATGAYTYTVTNASGCISGTSANINIDAQPATPSAPTIGTITHPTCAVASGDVVLNSLPAVGTWTLTRTPGGTTTSGVGTSTTISGLNTGTYTYTVTNILGCISAASANVIINAQPTAATPTVGTITQPTCTVATGSVVLNNLPATGTWTLTRNPGAVTSTGTGTSTTINGLVTGTYTYTVTNASGCVSSVSANVVINAQPTIPSAPAIGTITQPTCAVATGSVILSGLPATGTWTLTRTPGGTTTTGTGTSTTINGIVTGTYTYIVTNASGCVSVASANVVINAQPPIPSAPGIGTITQPTCTVATGSVDLNNLPATGSWTLTRNPGGITTTGTGTSTTINGLNTGTYTYTVTNASGCVSTVSANVIINAQPLASIPAVGTITQPTCTVATGSVVLNNLPASGTWTLTRNPGGITTTGTGTSTIINGLDAGTYTYTVTNSSGCTSGISVNVVINTQPATPSAPLVGAITQPSCAVATGSVVLSGLPATGTWTLTRTPGGTTTTGTGTSTTINGLAPGTFTYTVANASGCTSSASANVVIIAQPATPGTPAVGTITQPNCTVATGSVVLNNLPTTGTWILTRNPGAVTTSGTGTSATITGLNAGTYSYTVANSSGCISAVSANVVINTQPATPSAPAVGNITHPTCAIATGTVVLNNLPGSGTWTLTRIPGGTTTTGTGTSTTISGIPAGTYTYTVANASGCTSASSSNVVINAAPATPATPTVGALTQPTCTVATGSVTLNNLPATGTWTLTRSPGNITTTGTGTSTTINNLDTGAYTYTVTNASGCVSAASANVVINIQPLALAPLVGAITQPTCTVTTGSVVLSALPANGTWILTRNPGNITTTGTGTITTITGLNTGAYTYTVTNASGCTSAASGTVVIDVQPVTASTPAVGAITHPTCAIATGNVVLNNLPATGTWTLTRNPGGTTVTGTGTSTTINGLAAGTYTYTVTNASGCTSAASASVIINAQPAVPSAPVIGTIVQPTYIVPTGTVVLNGLPATGTWALTINPGNGTITGTGSSTSIIGLTPGTYTFAISGASGCISAASAAVVINAVLNMPPAANAGPDQTITLPVNFTTLTGSGTDIDGTVIGYEWKQLSGPSTNVLFSLNSAVTYANNLIEGVYQFEFAVTDNQGAKGRDTVNVTVLNIIPPASGLQNNSIRIYPNPVVDITTLEINKTNENVTVLQIITDVQGKTLLAKELTSQQNTILEKIDMRNFAKGIYFVTVMFKDFEKKTLKVIKAN